MLLCNLQHLRHRYIFTWSVIAGEIIRSCGNDYRGLIVLIEMRLCCEPGRKALVVLWCEA